jgi:hypothetical protein
MSDLGSKSEVSDSDNRVAVSESGVCPWRVRQVPILLQK